MTRPVYQSVIISKGREVSLPCSYRSTYSLIPWADSLAVPGVSTGVFGPERWAYSTVLLTTLIIAALLISSEDEKNSQPVLFCCSEQNQPASWISINLLHREESTSSTSSLSIISHSNTINPSTSWSTINQALITKLNLLFEAVTAVAFVWTAPSLAESKELLSRHVLLHTFASLCLKWRVTISKVLFGHSRYGEPVPSHIRKVVCFKWFFIQVNK